MPNFATVAAARKHLATLHSPTEKAAFVIKVAKARIDQEPIAALEFGEEALGWLEAPQHTLQKAEVCFELGRGYATVGDNERGIAFFEQAQTLFEELEKPERVAEIHIGMATVVWGKGDYDEGLERMYKGLELAEKYDNRRAQGWAHTFLGGFYYDLEAHEQAQFHYEQALPLTGTDKDPNVEARVLSGLCTVFIQKEDYAQAEAYAEQALALCQKHDMAYSRSRVLNDLGTIRKRQQRYPESFNFYQESLQIRRARSVQAAITTLTEMGELFLLQEHYDEARAYLSEAQEFAEHIEAKSKLARIHRLLSELSEQLEDYKDSLWHYKKASALRAKTVGDELQVKVRGLQSELAFERKSNEAEIERLRNVEIKRKNKAITDSINYAKRIQEALLPNTRLIRQYLPQFFAFYQPRDIVSGDFYWLHHDQNTNRTVLVAADCTGHGVPGAFMSLIGDALLKQIVQSQGIFAPERILEQLHKDVRRVLKQRQTQNRDGMDMTVCLIKHRQQEVQMAGAKNPLVYFRAGELYELKGDPFPIGGRQREKNRVFTRHQFSFAEEPVTFYLFSDGYQDQFGGAEGRKFMRKRFRNLLREIHILPMEKQLLELKRSLRQWQGEQRQVDDILVLGVRLAP